MDKNVKKTIWSNYDFNLEQERKNFIEFLIDNGISKEEAKKEAQDDSQVFDFYSENLGYCLDDERMNLDHLYYNRILVIGKLGLWNGVKTGCKVEINKTLGDMLYSECDYCEWYVDEDDEFKFKGAHHDGENNYTYRKVNDDVDDEQLETLYNMILREQDYSELLNEYTTKLGPEILERYGIKA